MSKKRINKNVINYSIIAVVFLVCIVYMVATEGLENIGRAFASLNYWWMLVALLLMGVYWLTEAGTLSLFIRKLESGKHVPFGTVFRVTMVGQLFNCITPFASGGQPMQAYYLVKAKMSLGGALTALISRFIIYQGTLTILSVGVIILRYQYFLENVSGFLVLALVGFIINTLVIFFLIAVGYFKNFVLFVIRPIIRLLAKIHILKQPDKTQEKWEREVESFSENMGFVRNNWRLTAHAALLTFVQLLAYFSLPFFIGLALNDFSRLDYINMVCAQAFVLMISSFVPLPGAAGAAEGSFLLFFSNFLSSRTVPYATFIWRIFTFYVPILVGALFLKRSKVRQGAPTDPDSLPD